MCMLSRATRQSTAKWRLGQRLDTEYEILSGVNPGETVVVAGQSRLKNGAKVKIVKK